MHYLPDGPTRMIADSPLIGWFHDDLVYVAPDPILARLEGLNERVLRGVEVPGGVLVLGAVATPYVAADEALPEMHPRVTHLEALLAPFGAGFHVADLVQVRTLLSQHFHEPPHGLYSSRGRLSFLPVRLLCGSGTVLTLYYDRRRDRAREG